MRKILLLMMISILLSSCISLEQITVTNVMDYSKFGEKGIFITEANLVNFEYTPIGSVSSITRGEVKNTFLSYRVNLDKAFEDIAKKLIGMNANGLINLKISNSADKNFYYMTVTGMAIRSKNPVINANDYKNTKK